MLLSVATDMKLYFPNFHQGVKTQVTQIRSDGMPGKRLCCLMKSVSAKLQFAMKTKVKMRPFEIMSSGQKNQRWSCLATVTVNIF